MGKKNIGFTLVELLAVLVVLSVILAIAVPTITGIIRSSQIVAFNSDAKLLLKTINLKKLENTNLNVTSITEANIGSILGLDYRNYRRVEVIVEDENIAIKIAGKGAWEGLSACGSYSNMRVIESVGCEGDIWPPVITIVGDNPVTIISGTPYVDAGATATDDVDGVIGIVTTGLVNFNKDGTYAITYTATDAAGNTATLERIVIVDDITSPSIMFNPNGDSIYAKSNNSVVSIQDGSGIDINSLKYLWSISTDKPLFESFLGTFTNNQIINTPSDETGSYYLWITVDDVVGNRSIMKSNAFNLDNTKPIITLQGSNSITIQKGSVYSDAGATASDLHSGIAGNVLVTGGVNPNIPGTYYIRYDVIDMAGNVADTVARTIDVVDISAPVITLLGSNPVNINVNAVYIDAGATALDDVDGNLSSSIIKTGTVNPSVPGTYTITYTVSDTALNTATKTRTVNVIDNIAPTVSFGINGNSTYARSRSTTATVNDIHTGVNTSSLKYLWNTSATTPTEVSFTTSFTNGGTISSPASATGGYYLWILAKDNAGNTTIQRTNVFNLDNTNPTMTLVGNSSVTIVIGTAYVDAGATASDNINGDITGNIIKTGTVNPNIAGTYTLTYNVSDSSGNAAPTLTRTVIVTDNITISNITSAVAFAVNANGIYIADGSSVKGYDFNGTLKWSTPFTVVPGMSGLSSRGGLLTLFNDNLAAGLYYSDGTYRHLGVMQLDKNGNYINLTSATSMSSTFGQAFHLYTECTSNTIAYYRGKAGSSYMNYFGHLNVSDGTNKSVLYYDDSGSYDYPRYPYYSNGYVYFWWDSNNGGNYFATYTLATGGYSNNTSPTVFSAPAQFYYSSPSIGTQYINNHTDMYEYANGKTYYLYKNATTLIYEVKIEPAS